MQNGSKRKSLSTLTYPSKLKTKNSSYFVLAPIRSEAFLYNFFLKQPCIEYSISAGNPLDTISQKLDQGHGKGKGNPYLAACQVRKC